MKTATWLGITTLALALSSVGCLIQPMSPEEAAEFEAEMGLLDEVGEQAEQDEALPGDPQDDVSKPDPTPWVDEELANDNVVPTEWVAMAGSNKPDPTPWDESSDSEGKPDPTPWRPMSARTKPDPTPWVPAVNGGGDSVADRITVVDGDGKPDPTPWKTMR